MEDAVVLTSDEFEALEEERKADAAQAVQDGQAHESNESNEYNS